MRRVAAILFLGLCAIGLAGAGQPAPPRLIEFNAADRAALDRISAYLNTIHTMKGGFLQIGPNGEVDQGEFALSKPGRVRFQYDPPTPTLIVSDGSTVAVENTRLKTIDRYSLSDTPLGLILGADIDLAHNKQILGVEHQQGALVVKARTSTNRSQSNISLVFAEPELELRQWTVIDNQGLSTTFALRDAQSGVPLSPALFALPVKEPAVRKSLE